MDKSKYYGADVFEKYYQAIISSLPMKDVTFLAKLQEHRVLSDHTKTVLQSLSASIEMASYLVDNAIKPELSEGITDTFDQLLRVMEGSSFDNVCKLGTVVNKELTASKRMYRRVCYDAGNDYVGEAARKGVQKAICWIKRPTKKTLATGFIGYVKLHGKPSYVLVTNCHALDSEEVAADSVIGFDGSDEQLSMKELTCMVKNSFSSSRKKKLDFAMIEIDWNRLKGYAQFIDMTKPVSVKKGDFITVIQYDSEKRELIYSSSECFLAGCLLIYECGSSWTTSDGVVVKAVDGNFEVVGLHRGKLDVMFNCGTILKDILKSISGKVYNAGTHTVHTIIYVKSHAKTKVAGMKDIKSMKKGQGHIPVNESARRQVIRAVCLIRAHGKDGKEMMGTGFFGSMQLSDKSSVVLVTNYHVIGDEEVAGKSILEFEGVDVQLELKELMVETTFVCSDMKKLDYAMIEIDWSKLKQKHPVAEYIHLSEPAAIDNHDYITIIQHPGGGELSFSSSTCIAYEYLLLYTSETACGSSGGPILKATKGGLEIVGLHRGGHEDHYNYGSKFSEILLSISENKNHEEKSPKDHAIVKYYRRLSSEQGK
ncbi:uncharacterized protein [Dysidea avara]|uniref:uncharacterized protein isoform X2 n=1 Tax=Dysidea avara TaxID=196820 RepID=UPI00332DB13B